MTAQFPIDPALVERYVLDLARHGACAETGVCRTVYSPEWVAAQDQVAAWCAEAGLAVWRDAVGNVWGRLAGTDNSPAVVTGSHIDTQLPGGRYDGALGVIAGILALRALKERHGAPRRSLDVVSFCQEEGSRFPRAGFWASRALLGRIAPDEPDTLRAYGGETMREAMRDVGLDPARIPEARRDDIAAYIELHVEQGPVLEEAGLAVGVVDAITGSRTYNVTITGRSDHGGGCPMDLRHDPMAPAAELITAALGVAREMGRPAVTTVGRLLVEPNYPAIVPERVTLAVNARHPYAAGYATLGERQEATLAAVRAAHPEVAIAWTARGGAPTPCAPEIVRLLEDAAHEQGIPALTMPSGGGHDCQVMATRFPAAMIFVQSRDGRSHTPAEYTAPEHAAAGIQLLAAALHRLAY
ncbi:MAG TPA: M20 family metallo-hydrolase [Thermomicrobiales bacterium]|nr:M20 family metallo-hydrolase [Thermomicrobiales bacterium]